MSSHSRPDRSGGVAALAALLLVVAMTASGAAPEPEPASGGQAPSTDPRVERRKVLESGKTSAVDDSTTLAWKVLGPLCLTYGGRDNWARIEGVRYYVTYRIPGPDDTTVREWTESHIVWLRGGLRARIDNAADSTIVVVRGDSTLVRRGGAWSTDPAVLAAGRKDALQALWLLRMPRGLMVPAIKARLETDPDQGGPVVMRFEAGAGTALPEGTRLWVTFAPPTFAIRSVRWYDPQSRGWFRLDYDTERTRYEWTWAEHRTLRASDASGAAGPVLWTALIEDMQVEPSLPVQVLDPPGAVTAAAHP